jgi:RNA polymerase sigma-70 factor (ECF subfamily)
MDGAPLAERTRVLVADHYDALYRYAYRLSGNHGDAEDLVQETFVIVLKKLDQVREFTSVRTWLYTVLRNCYLKEIRRNAPLVASNLADDLTEIPDEVEDTDIDREQLQAAINELSDEFKLVVLQFYFEDCSYLEISKNLELPVGTVMSRLSRAKAHIRRRLLADNCQELAATPKPRTCQT